MQPRCNGRRSRIKVGRRTRPRILNTGNNQPMERKRRDSIRKCQIKDLAKVEKQERATGGCTAECPSSGPSVQCSVPFFCGVGTQAESWPPEPPDQGHGACTTSDQTGAQGPPLLRSSPGTNPQKNTLVAFLSPAQPQGTCCLGLWCRKPHFSLLPDSPLLWWR